MSFGYPSCRATGKLYLGGSSDSLYTALPSNQSLSLRRTSTHDTYFFSSRSAFFQRCDEQRAGEWSTEAKVSSLPIYTSSYHPPFMGQSQHFIRWFFIPIGGSASLFRPL